MARKREKRKTSLNSLALRNARTFKLLSLRVRCIRVGLLVFPGRRADVFRLGFRLSSSADSAAVAADSAGGSAADSAVADSAADSAVSAVYSALPSVSVSFFKLNENQLWPIFVKLSICSKMTFYLQRKKENFKKKSSPTAPKKELPAKIYMVNHTHHTLSTEEIPSGQSGDHALKSALLLCAVSGLVRARTASCCEKLSIGSFSVSLTLTLPFLSVISSVSSPSFKTSVPSGRGVLFCLKEKSC